MLSGIVKRLVVETGDITKIQADAIVTAANEALCGGGGVDGAIHRAAGPELLRECLKIGGCPQGESRITRGFNLPSKFVIHTVGPVWEGGGFGEAGILAACYRASLQLAKSHQVESIVFPGISTGVYGYPKREACAIAVDNVVAWLAENELPSKVVFSCFTRDDALLYEDKIAELNS